MFLDDLKKNPGNEGGEELTESTALFTDLTEEQLVEAATADDDVNVDTLQLAFAESAIEFENLRSKMIVVEHRSIVEKNEQLLEAAVGDMWEKVKTFFRNLWEKIKAFFKRIWARVSSLWTSYEKYAKQYEKQAMAGHASEAAATTKVTVVDPSGASELVGKAMKATEAAEAAAMKISITADANKVEAFKNAVADVEKAVEDAKKVGQLTKESTLKAVNMGEIVAMLKNRTKNIEAMKKLGEKGAKTMEKLVKSFEAAKVDPKNEGKKTEIIATARKLADLNHQALNMGIGGLNKEVSTNFAVFKKAVQLGTTAKTVKEDANPLDFEMGVF